MTAISKIESIDWALASAAIMVLLVVVCVVCVMLLRDSRKRLRFYEHFGKNVTEGIVVLSQRLEYLYSMPLFMEEPLMEKLVEGQSFQEILDPKDWSRMRLFFEETEKHRDIPFLFSVKINEKDIQWYELHCFIYRVSLAEYHYVCFLKNISKEQDIRKKQKNLQNNLDLMLKTTGDFLWSMDIEKRQVRFLTPVLDDDLSFIPQSAGSIDRTSIMPETDIALLDNLANRYIRLYKQDKTVIENMVFPPVKVRLYSKDKSLLWYNLRGLLNYDENGNMAFQGVARRLDVMMDNFIFDSSQNENALFSAALSLPDLRVFWVDRDYRIIGANQGFANDFGIIDLESIRGKSLNKVVNSKFVLYFNKILSNVFETGRRVSWTSGEDKIDKPIAFNAVPLKMDTGIVLQAMCAYFKVNS